MRIFKEIRVVVLLFSLIVVSHAQNTKRKVTIADYAKWSSLREEAISPDALWISYKLQYDYGADTLFIQHRKTGKKLIYPSADNAVFSKDGKWITFTDPVKGLGLQELKSGQVQYFKDVINHEFHPSNKYLMVLAKGADKKELIIVDYGHKKNYSFNDVNEYSISTQGKIAISTVFEIRIIEPEQNFIQKTIAKSNSGTFKKLFWSDNGNALAFLEQHTKDSLTPINYKIRWYNIKDSKTVVLDSDFHKELKPFHIIVKIGTPAITFSPNGKKLFFLYCTPRPALVDDPIQIWDSGTPLEYGQHRFNGNPEQEPKLAVWLPEIGQILKIGTPDSPSALLTPDKKYAVCFNKLQYEPQYEYYAPADLSIKDCTNGTERLFLQKHSTAVGMFSVSPNGKLVNYFKDGNWWVYDILQNEHRNLTGGLLQSFTNKQKDYSGPPSPYESPGWSADSKFLLAYDEFDIWLLSGDGKIKLKITDGRTKKNRYRICIQLYQKSKPHNPNELYTQSFDLTKGLILEEVSDKFSNGYFKWKYPNSITKLIVADTGIDRLKMASGKECYIFVEQTASMPPRLMYIDSFNKKPVVIIQSNPHSLKYESAKANLIEYKNAKEENLKGILYKPAGYQHGKKYPMVVFIYEKLSSGLHSYYKPTEFQSMGFTPANYFLDEYLVLYPDIKYTVGNPGLSAVDCVESAVNAVKEMGIVEENHIGIIGHSFGGYEVSFIITKTNTFAAAISGSGVMDLVTSYFTYGSTLPRSNTWRFESQQFRMQGSPYDDWEAYERNSPLHNATKINTPLMTWAGKNDPSVFWTQSAAFHLALRRLNKRNVFLLFPGENHNVIAPELQKILTTKTKNWFDYYLKEKSSALKNGIP